MEFSIALLSLTISIVSAGQVKPSPTVEEYEGLASVDFEFALGVKDHDMKQVTVLALLFELEDGQLKQDGCHIITCDSCYSYPTPKPVSQCDDCDEKKVPWWYGYIYGTGDDKKQKFKKDRDSYDVCCEVEDDEDIEFFRLRDTVLTNEKNKLGEIVANHQFQFDPFPGKPDALYTKGFTIVEKDEQYLLALYGETKFWHCKVDDNGLYKIHDASIGSHCLPIELVIVKQKEQRKGK